MKNLTKLLLGLLLLTSITYTGCKQASELIDVKFTADYEDTLNVVVTPSTNAKTTNGVFSVSKTIDPTSNSDFAKYIDKIKSINISEVSGLVISVNPNLTLTSAVINVSDANHTATWTFTNLPITVGTLLSLDNNDGQWDAIEQILMDKTPFTVSIVGQASEDNAEFSILVNIKSDVIANPIN